jgi:hypothetical protein
MTSESKPKPGDTVLLTHVPSGLLDNLPKEDQTAISEIVGKPVRLNDYDEQGRAELEFKDSSGGIHFVYVSPTVIRVAK